MALAVLGAEPLDELQQLAESLFSDVVNINVPLPLWPESPYGDAELQTKIEIVPIKDLRHLSVMFPIPDITQHYKSSVSKETNSISILININNELISCLMKLFKHHDFYRLKDTCLI